jgi:hypothetical protein
MSSTTAKMPPGISAFCQAGKSFMVSGILAAITALSLPPDALSLGRGQWA